MATAGEETVRRLRLRRGRVMHAVTGLSSGIPGWLRPVCKRVSATPAEDWTDERLWYPDCVHCDRKLATPE